MKDDLLDLELEQIAFAQPRQLLAILRVPYKVVGDSQIDQSGDLRDLEYNDSYRSDPNSTRLDLT